ncbi:hypothetical protein [Plastoroseomonas arctica]|uniref:Dienelactone hydrolase domain-containing protein n=1 Tax=Plastoroseomonas arctica TaxID=1509237 RepID=A0AAF1KPK3_9PROT|nr:hypothetical protein [Plastoroseomonas arctica]MBR0656098.1 hypothetical protein [Plastoroseomonas arctica]
MLVATLVGAEADAHEHERRTSSIAESAEVPADPDGTVEAFTAGSAAGLLSLPPGPADRRLPAVIILHDSLGADGRSAAYIDQLIGAGIAVLDLVEDPLDEAAEVVAALAAHPRIARQPLGVLGFGAGARRAATLRATLAARALLYPGCAALPFAPMPREPVLLVNPSAGLPPDTAPECARLVEGLRGAGADIRTKTYPGAGYAWDYPAYGVEGVFRLPLADGSRRVRVEPRRDLAALSATDVAGFFAASLLAPRR